jgi:PKD repeat protein
MIDMFFGPYKDTQALYVIKYGNNNSILRIRYIGLPPVAVIEAKNSNNNNNNQHQQQETEGTAGSLLPTALPNGNVAYSVGDAVKFDGSGSLDPDGGELTFQWDFGDRNDSTTNTTSPSPSHIYDEPGDYTVILVVTNSKDQAHLVSTTVLVIGKPPTAVMVSPMEGDIFTVGEVLRLNGEAYDYRGNRIPDDQLTWEVRGYHSDDGFDFFLEGTSGNDFDLNPVPEPRDFSPPEIMYLRVILFVTDDNGLITKIETDVYPNIVAIKLVAEPPQESMTIDGIAPTESPSMVEPVSNSTLPNETNIDSRPNPTIPNITSSMEDNIKLNLESGNTKLDKGQKKEENDSTYGMKPLEKWLIGICTTFLLIAPFYLGWKYYQLKCKLETDSTHSSSKEFQDKTSVPKNIEAISRKKEYTSTGNGDSVITNVSLSSSNISSSTSSASFSSSNVYSNRSAAIWEKIAEETERRTKLRAKYSSGIAVATTTPGTPETTETRESPSNLDSASSPSSDLSTNIDETLSRLDDLLEKCSTRKQARNARKQERNNFSFSSNQESLPGSPLREKNDDSLVEATFSMASLYSAGSLQDDSNESQVLNLLEVSNTSLNLPEVSNTSVQSLLIFQDNDLSMSYRASSIHDRDIHDDLMESGLVVDGDRTTTSDLVDIDECHSLVGNENDLDQYLG